MSAGEDVLLRRLERERAIRREAERIAERSTRGVLRGIHPPALDHVGLGVALAELAREAGEHGPIADARSTIRDDATATVHDELVMVLARELVRNVVEHARAGRLELSLAREGDHLHLLVADDGLGIPAGRRERALAGGHLGTASCAERAATVGGRITVSPNGRWPVPGTRVEVVLPL